MTALAPTRRSNVISLPVYRRIEQDLRARINDGIWTANMQIPGRRELAREYHVEVSTVQRAIANLLDDGVLRAEAGRGTFVAIGPTTHVATVGPSLRFAILLRDSQAMSNPESYMSRIVQGIRRALAPHGLRHSIAFVEEQDLDQIMQMQRTEMAGVLFASPDIDRRTHIDHLWKLGLPLVVVGSSWVGIEAPFVDCDNFEGTNRALDLLVAQGHTRIACGVVNANACHHYDRGQAFRTGMAQRGLEIAPGHMIERWKPAPEDGYADMYRLLSAPDRPTALVAADPSQGINAIRIAHELGLSVPRDLSITTFDDQARLEHTQPPLTTVAAPFEDMGERAMSLLIDMSEGRPHDRSRDLLPMRLIERESIGRVPERLETMAASKRL